MRPMLNVKVPNREGLHLATDVWLPDGSGPFPVIFTRTPYSRAGLGAQAPYYTDRGYAYVTQDTRGRYDSEGLFRPLLDEGVDGQDSIAWIAEQGWCDGHIGMVGGSYLGMVILPAAAAGHEALKCIVPGIAPNDFFRDWIRNDGCYALANSTRWALTQGVCTTEPAQSHFTWEEVWGLGTLQEIEHRIGFSAPVLHDWIAHDHYDEYWQELDQTLLHSKIACPALHTGGWFDHLSRGQFASFAGIRKQGATALARDNQRLLIGPWGHVAHGRAYGLWDFGPEAEFGEQDYALRFCDLWLRGIDDGITQEPPVKVFHMGPNRWVGLSSWPPPEATAKSLYLESGGHAIGPGSDGRLVEDPAGGSIADEFTYDPCDPVPSCGGQLYWLLGSSRVGPQDQRMVLQRSDVLYYRGPLLSAPVTVMGTVELDLWIASDAADTDIVAKLCVVETSGRVVALNEGCLRCRYRNSWSHPEPLEPGTPARVRVELGNLAYTFPAGSRIAVIITSSSFPRILPHPNTMAPSWQERCPRVARNAVVHGGEHLSRLVLPVVEG